MVPNQFRVSRRRSRHCGLVGDSFPAKGVDFIRVWRRETFITFHGDAFSKKTAAIFHAPLYSEAT
jgi:hypothetical protein